MSRDADAVAGALVSVVWFSLKRAGVPVSLSTGHQALHLRVRIETQWACKFCGGPEEAFSRCVAVGGMSSRLGDRFRLISVVGRLGSK